MYWRDGTVPCDVTARAGEFLFDYIEASEDLRLRDLFFLLGRNNVLLSDYRRLHAPELFAEAISSIFAPPVTETVEPIDYLEIARECEFTTTTEFSGEVMVTRRVLELSSVGHPITEPAWSGNTFQAVGDRVRRDVSSVPLGEILHRPLHFASAALDSACSLHGERVRYLPATEDLCLGQLLFSVLHAFSCMRDWGTSELEEVVVWERPSLTRALSEQLMDDDRA